MFFIFVLKKRIVTKYGYNGMVMYFFRSTLKENRLNISLKYITALSPFGLNT